MNKIPGKDTSIPLYAGISLENTAEEKNQKHEIPAPAPVDALFGVSGETCYICHVVVLLTPRAK